eukprot:1371775-Amorphochlora_amoeboformis.AAC.1
MQRRFPPAAATALGGSKATTIHLSTCPVPIACRATGRSMTPRMLAWNVMRGMSARARRQHPRLCTIIKGATSVQT